MGIGGMMPGMPGQGAPEGQAPDQPGQPNQAQAPGRPGGGAEALPKRSGAPQAQEQQAEDAVEGDEKSAAIQGIRDRIEQIEKLRSALVALDAKPDDSEGRWATLEGGTKVFIGGKGEIEKGPKDLKGKTMHEIKSGSPATSSSSGSKPKAPPKTTADRSKAKSRNGIKMQKRYGGEANHEGVGNGSQGHTPKYKNGNGMTRVNPKDVDEGEHTIKKHLAKDGSLTPERETLHKSIVDKHFEAVTKPDGQPVFTMMGGGPNAGKLGLEIRTSERSG